MMTVSVRLRGLRSEFGRGTVRGKSTSNLLINVSEVSVSITSHTFYECLQSLSYCILVLSRTKCRRDRITKVNTNGFTSVENRFLHNCVRRIVTSKRIILVISIILRPILRTRGQGKASVQKSESPHSLIRGPVNSRSRSSCTE